MHYGRTILSRQFHADDLCHDNHLFWRHILHLFLQYMEGHIREAADRRGGCFADHHRWTAYGDGATMCGLVAYAGGGLSAEENAC